MERMLALLLLAAAPAVALVPHDASVWHGATLAPGLLSRVTLTEAAASDGAVCLDGSAPVYYWRPGSGSGAKSWVLFLEVRCQRPPRSSPVALSSTLTES